MQYFLKTLDDLVINQMNTSVTTKVIINRDTLEDWLCVAQVEAMKLKEIITNQSFVLDDDRTFKRFISTYHSRLIYLNDLLLEYINFNECNEQPEGVSVKCVQKAIFLVIDDLLGFIWKNYSEYCNFNHKVPEKTRHLFVKCFSEKIQPITKSECYANYEIVRVALQPILKMTNEEEFRISFHLEHYFRELLKEIQHFANSNLREMDLHSFRKQLIFLNFNSLHFSDYLISEINQITSRIESIHDKIDKLSWFLKMLNQYPVRPDIVYVPKQKWIKDFMIEWLLEEISYLEKKLQLTGNAGTEAELMERNFKVITVLSVSQVACLIRLLVKSGVIKNKNQKELIRFYALYTQSKKQENISYESFRSKFYNIEESSRQDIKELIIKLLNEINKL